MAPSDFRQLPVTNFGWSLTILIVRPIILGVIPALSLIWLDQPAIFNAAFTLTVWGAKVQGVINPAEGVTSGLDEVKMSKWDEFWLQLGSYVATLFFLGWGWPIAVFVSKMVLVVIALLATIHLPLLIIGRCPDKIKHAYGTFLAIYQDYWRIAVSFTFNGIMDIWDYVDAVQWYVLPWGLRLAGQYIETKLWSQQGAYKYTAVDSSNGQIRLLRIHRQLIFVGHLRCSVEIAHLNNIPQYEALSYRWGFGSSASKLEYRTIFVDGKSLKVPKSAWELLHALSSLYGDRFVWIDAICINQEDITERAAQIPLMDQIYSKAHRTIVWPGDNFDSGMAARMLQRLFLANYQFDAEDEEYLSLFEDEVRRTGWGAMIMLFENPYFTRIWCVQEVALGRDTDIYHGNQYIPWDMFSETLITYMRPRRKSLLAWSTADSMGGVVRDSSVQGPSGIVVMDAIRQMQQKKAQESDLSIGYLLSYCAQFHATVAVDRIFGLNGLIEGFEKLIPNYTDVEPHLFFLAASVLGLKHSKQPFAALMYAGIGWESQSHQLPSWVVDWARPINHFSLWSPMVLDPYAAGQSTATHLPPGVITDPNSGLLFVTGFILDRITRQTTAVSRASPSDKNKTRWQRAIMRSQWCLDAEDLAVADSRLYPFSQQTRTEAFWRAVIADRIEVQGGRPAPHYLEGIYEVYREFCKARLTAPSDDVDSWNEHVRSRPEIQKLWPSTLQGRGRLHDYMSAIALSGDGRRFAVTKGGLMCLTPLESRVGDVIGIFHRAPIPFLLRRDWDTPTVCYKLVGECFVHGFMDRFDRIPNFTPPPSTVFKIS
jgi:hypothetical protein